MNQRVTSLFLVVFLAAVGLFSLRPVSAQTVSLVKEGEEKKIQTDIQIPDSETLFREYVEKKMPARVQSQSASRPRMAIRNRRMTLNETDRKVYDLLRTQIIKIVDGESASSVLTISLKDVFGEEVESYYTAQELGVSQIVSDNEITDEAVDALDKKFYIDFELVVHCLMADCPYELYWYDKTVGICMTCPVVHAVSAGKEYSIGYDDDPIQEITFSCSQDYSDGTYEEMKDGSFMWIGLDTEKTGAVTNAAENAREVVGRHDGEDDFTKISSYRDEICALVSYNYNAAYDDSLPYGDPWQLIWVFDEDPATNVVCEGYAKAFQYLCDLSEFKNDVVETFTVTGDFTDSNGSGGHMWNIVTMDDHNNYLMDVTNCDNDKEETDLGFFLAVPDEGSVSDGYAFVMDGYSCSYNYDRDTRSLYEDEILTLSTEAFYYCIHPGLITLDGVKATCTETGLTEGSKCSVCGRTITAQKIVAATGHHWNDGVITLEATSQAEGKRTFNCTNCGETKVEAIPRLPLPPVKPETGGEGSAGSDGPVGVTPSTVPVTGIKITGISKRLAAGTKVQLSAAVMPAKATVKTLRWSSGNAKIATVNQKGLVHIKKKTGGKTVIITAKAMDGSGKKAVFKIRVMKGTVKKITVKGYKKTLKVNKTMQLKASVMVTKGKPVNKKLKWTSSNTKFATVTQTGKVKALKAGKGKKVKIKVMSTDGTNKSVTRTIMIK